MSGRRRVATYQGRKVCNRCGRPVYEHRPVYLVKTASGLIVGPYHAQCAAVVAEDARAHGVEGAELVRSEVEVSPAAREETLPW